MTVDDSEDYVPPEYREDEGPAERVVPAPPRRDAIAEMRAALPLAREVSAIQGRVREAIREADRRMDQMEAIARLDLAVDIIKSIPLPEPINFIVDGIAEGIRVTIRKLMT